MICQLADDKEAFCRKIKITERLASSIVNLLIYWGAKINCFVMATSNKTGPVIEYRACLERKKMKRKNIVYYLISKVKKS